MAWTLIKWSFVAAIVVITVLAVFGKKTFHVELTIPAAPEAVWEVLTDAPGYAEWNPVFVKVEGEFREGMSVRTTVREPGKPEIVITSKVLKASANTELNQFGGIRGFITFDHQWLLQPVEDGTRVIQHEVDRGLWVWFWKSDWVEPAYLRASEALRDRVMRLHGG